MSGDTGPAIIALLALGLTVYATRVLGLILAPLLSRLPRVQKVIQVLPGCALIAVVAPPTIAAGPFQMLAVVVTFGLYWVTGRVFVTLSTGVLLLVGFGHLGL